MKSPLNSLEAFTNFSLKIVVLLAIILGMINGFAAIKRFKAPTKKVPKVETLAPTWALSVTERYFDGSPFAEYGSAVDHLGKKKYWYFKFELYSEEGGAFNAEAYLKRFPNDAVSKNYTGDGHYGVKIFTNSPRERVKSGWLKVKNNRYD